MKKQPFKIELIKKETIHEGIWFNIYINDSCELSFREEEPARLKYEEIKQRAIDKHNEYPKLTTLEKIIIA